MFCILNEEEKTSLQLFFAHPEPVTAFPLCTAGTLCQISQNSTVSLEQVCVHKRRKMKGKREEGNGEKVWRSQQIKKSCRKFPVYVKQTKKTNSSKKPNFHLITCNLYLFDKEGIPEGISDFKSNYQQCFDCWCLWAAICFCLVFRYCHVNQICGYNHRQLYHVNQGKYMLKSTSSHLCLRQSHFIQVFF